MVATLNSLETSLAEAQVNAQEASAYGDTAMGLAQKLTEEMAEAQKEADDLQRRAAAWKWHAEVMVPSLNGEVLRLQGLVHEYQERAIAAEQQLADAKALLRQSLPWVHWARKQWPDFDKTDADMRAWLSVVEAMGLPLAPVREPETK